MSATQTGSAAPNESATRISYVRPAIVLTIVLTLVTGVIYPAVTTGISGALFNHQAAGSLITDGDKVIGSSLIGQNFTHNNYFWGRLSATSNSPYNPMATGGSNLAASNPALDKIVADRVAALRAADPQSYKPMSAASLLRRNLWIYGVGGLLVPFVGIKLIDMILTVLHLS